MLYAIDLFCGAGGMSEGLIQAGFNILFSSDINPEVQITYMNRHNQLGFFHNINTYYHRGDICNLSGEFIWNAINNLEIFQENRAPDDIDAIFGGPPCQGFSRAGMRDPNDPRNLLFREYVRVISEIHPKYVVMENVVGFLDTKFYGFQGLNGLVYEDESLAPEILRNELANIGYSILEPKILDASDYGVPQRRNRIIFIGYRNDVAVPHYPEPTIMPDNQLTVKDAISDLIINPRIRQRLSNGITEYQNISRRGRTTDINGNPININEVIHNNELANHSRLISERFSLFKEGETGSEVRKRIRKKGISLLHKPHLTQECARILGLTQEEVVNVYRNRELSDDLLDALLTKKNVRTRLHGDEPSATVMTIPDDYIHPYENRTFTVRELARLQSFDDSFVFYGKRTTGGTRRRVEIPQFSQVGNAVPPLLAKAVASAIIETIGEGH